MAHRVATDIVSSSSRARDTGPEWLRDIVAEAANKSDAELRSFIESEVRHIPVIPLNKDFLQDDWIRPDNALKLLRNRMFDFDGMSVDDAIQLLSTHIVRSAMNKDFTDLVKASMVCIRISFHKNSEVNQDNYADLPLFKTLTMSGREKSAVNWKENRELNATAMRLIGHILVHVGYKLSLGDCVKLTSSRGTIFQPLPFKGEIQSEYERICIEKSKLLPANADALIVESLDVIGPLARHIFSSVPGSGGVAAAHYKILMANIVNSTF